MATNRLKEAKSLLERVLRINEKSNVDNPTVAIHLNNLAKLLKDINRLKEAELLFRRSVEILIKNSRITGNQHPHLMSVIVNYAGLLELMGWSREQILEQIRKIGLNV